MTNIKAFALVVVGILIFTGACVYAGEVYSSDASGVTGEGDLRTRATELMADIRSCDSLSMSGKAPGTFDPDKVSRVRGQQVMTELDVKGIEFQLEVLDVSGAETTYSRSTSTGNAIQTANPPTVVESGQLITVSSAADIWVGPDEVHAARLVLRVWEA